MLAYQEEEKEGRDDWDTIRQKLRWTDGWTDGWMDRWMDGLMNTHTYTFMYTYIKLHQYNVNFRKVV